MGDRAASGAGWALGQPEKVIDYGNRANHLTAAAAKSLVQAYYGSAPKYSYFQGCSNGGREALMEAQRYPEDYDGIIAGAPAYDWISLVAGMAWNTLARDALPDGMLPVAKLTVLQNAVLEQCDALDGVSDGWLDDPRRCAFDPGTVQCKSGDGDDCLSAAEVVAVRKIYSGPKTAAGKQIYPGFPPGSEAEQWNQWLTGAETDAAMFSTEYFRNMVFEKPDWELAQLNLDRDLPIARAKHDKIMVSNNPDLRAFAKRGGDFPHEHAVLDPHGFYSVRHSLAIMRCEIYDIVTAGDHDLVIGEVVHFESSPGEPLIFHRGAFGGLDEDALVPRGRVIGISDGEGWM